MTGFLPEQRRSSNGNLVGRVVVKKGDITRESGVDAIVCSLMADLNIDGSLNRALFEAAGKKFDDYVLENIYKPKPGDVYAVPGFSLPVRHVIFAITPIWRDDFDKEDAHLVRCYRKAMAMAVSMTLRKIAFPVLASGRFGYPLDRASRIAVTSILEGMTPAIQEVRIICNKDSTFEAVKDKLNRVGRKKGL